MVVVLEASWSQARRAAAMSLAHRRRMRQMEVGLVDHAMAGDLPGVVTTSSPRRKQSVPERGQDGGELIFFLSPLVSSGTPPATDED